MNPVYVPLLVWLMQRIRKARIEKEKGSTVAVNVEIRTLDEVFDHVMMLAQQPPAAKEEET